MTTYTSPTQSPRLLRNALRGNASFSLLSGLTMLIIATPIAQFLGVAAPTSIRFIGINLIGFALALIWLANQPTIKRRWALTAVILDDLWVIGSTILLLTTPLPLTKAGQWSIALIAVIVAIFAITQFIGILQMGDQ